jgi:hypothetical protein
MDNTLETWSWIAAIAVIPLTVIGWFVAGGKKKINKSAASRGGVASSGDVRVDGPGSFATGHNSPVNVNLTVGGNGSEARERRYAVYRAARSLIDEAHARKLISDETLRCFVTRVRDAPLTFDDDELVTYLNEMSERARKFQSITMVMEDLPAGEEKAAAAKAAGEQRLWLIAQNDNVLTEKFRRSLQPFDTGPQVPTPDWSIRNLFFHIHPDLIDDPQNHAWEAVGRDVIDKFSTSRLKVWGRRIEDSRRLALAEIPPEEWPRAKFTYWFLKEGDGVSLDVVCPRPSRGSAPAQYADLRVCRAQALTIWPKSPV